MTRYLNDSPKVLCRNRFYHELEFWQIPRTCISTCCYPDTETEGREEADPLMKKRGSAKRKFSSAAASRKMSSSILSESSVDVDQFKFVAFGELRSKIWTFFEEPSSSTLAKVFAFLSGSVVLLSILALVLGSMPDLQVQAQNQNETDNKSLLVPLSRCFNMRYRIENPCTAFSEYMDRTRIRTTHPIFEYIELFCVIWFTIEYTIRLFVCAKRWRHVWETMNLIDLASIAPFYVEVVFYLSGIGDGGNESRVRIYYSHIFKQTISMAIRVVAHMRVHWTQRDSANNTPTVTWVAHSKSGI